MNAMLALTITFLVGVLLGAAFGIAAAIIQDAKDAADKALADMAALNAALDRIDAKLRRAESK